MLSVAEQLAAPTGLNQVLVPDLWQQQAVAALRAGRDVVVQAPTGAGKTLIFELWSNQGKPRGRAIYTVPTRALANDKLAEWRARGWDVGIATGDLAENLAAPILVATLETQKNRLIHDDGPDLLVVDEYQMIADPDRGLNYELAIALAPPRTRLLLLSGSVANPEDVARWLRRLGRDAVVIRTDHRPVPLEEVHAASLSFAVPAEIRGYWPRLVAKALAEGLGPLLIFAPRRQAAEALAEELARQLPCPHPLTLSPLQRRLVGEHLARLLKARVAFHHSGLSYGARAGVIEPLAKAGQLRVVVATMGLAAGINFSLRSVALAGDSYRRDLAEQPLRPDELLQMFGRAGRRGIDDTGYLLVSANEIRLLDAHALHLTRNGMVDWAALLGLMAAADARGEDPLPAAARVQERLFTSKPIPLGIEFCLQHPEAPCGLKTDAERARRVRTRLREICNSRGEWERQPPLREVPLRDLWIVEPNTPPPAGDTANAPAPRLRRALSEPRALEKIGTGELCRVGEQDGLPVYGRSITLAERLPGDRVRLAKWLRRLTNWHGRQADLATWRAQILPRVHAALATRHTPVLQVLETPEKILARVSLAELTLKAPVDRYGVALWRPPAREVEPPECARCDLASRCRQLSPASGTAALWRRLGLVDAAGRPTRRGRLVSFFSQSDGLAIAAALEDPTYPIEELAYDLANLDAGFRFAGDDNRWGGRLAVACHQAYGLQTIPGYLENGLPPKYGAGAEVIVAAVHRDPAARHAWAGELLGPGDIDRAIIEWRSLLRQIAHAPALDWPRWQALQERARAILQETTSPTLTDLPPLEPHQTRRLEHHLPLRRH
jgi:superfamily II DNA/RNA helicase